MAGSVAVADGPFHAEYSAFPFLRQRAIEGSASLDPSLVDWAARHFPADDEKTFAAPPLPRGSDDEAAASALVSADRPGASISTKQAKSRPPGLTASLDEVMGATDVVADARGVYYSVRPFTDRDEASYGEQKLRKPRKARGGVGASPFVRKVRWETVEMAKQQRKTPDVHRAKERLVRLTRGEDPQGIQ